MYSIVTDTANSYKKMLGRLYTNQNSYKYFVYGLIIILIIICFIYYYWVNIKSIIEPFAITYTNTIATTTAPKLTTNKNITITFTYTKPTDTIATTDYSSDTVILSNFETDYSLDIVTRKANGDLSINLSKYVVGSTSNAIIIKSANLISATNIITIIGKTADFSVYLNSINVPLVAPNIVGAPEDRPSFSTSAKNPYTLKTADLISDIKIEDEENIPIVPTSTAPTSTAPTSTAALSVALSVTTALLSAESASSTAITTAIDLDSSPSLITTKSVIAAITTVALQSMNNSIVTQAALAAALAATEAIKSNAALSATATATASDDTNTKATTAAITAANQAINLAILSAKSVGSTTADAIKAAVSAVSSISGVVPLNITIAIFIASAVAAEALDKAAAANLANANATTSTRAPTSTAATTSTSATTSTRHNRDNTGIELGNDIDINDNLNNMNDFFAKNTLIGSNLYVSPMNNNGNAMPEHKTKGNGKITSTFQPLVKLS